MNLFIDPTLLYWSIIPPVSQAFFNVYSLVGSIDIQEKKPVVIVPEDYLYYSWPFAFLYKF